MTTPTSSASAGPRWGWGRQVGDIFLTDYASKTGVPLTQVEKLLGWEPYVSIPAYKDAKGNWRQDMDARYISHPDTGKVLGHHSDTYTSTGYIGSLLEPMESILATVRKQLLIRSAGMLDGGKVAWISVATPDDIVGPGGVKYRPYILGASSLDASISTSFNGHSDVVVCRNTLDAGIGEGFESGLIYSQKRTSGFGFDVIKAQETMGIMHRLQEAFEGSLSTLLDTKVSRPQWTKFLDLYVEIKPAASSRQRTMRETKRDALTTLYTNDERAATWTGTAWGVLQAVNTYEEHESIVRDTSGVFDRDNPADMLRMRTERNALRIITGEASKIDNVALTTLSKVLAKG
jgi:phage/plasmid-like protein (TIGR03299 family)